MISSDRVSIPSNADVPLVADEDASRGVRAIVEFLSAGTVYLGPEGVTSDDGFRWDGVPLEIDLEHGDVLHARAASGTIEADVLYLGA